MPSFDFVCVGGKVGAEVMEAMEGMEEEEEEVCVEEDANEAKALIFSRS
jgi:hypothetical protein